MMVSDGWEMTIQGEPRQASYVRTSSKQLLLGLDFLHKRGIIHTDLQPANILFSVNDAGLSDISLNPPEYSPVNWLNGVDVDDSAPKYLMTSQRRRGMPDDADPSTVLVKIGDMGGAIWSGQSDQRPVTPTGLRAPELIHGDPWDASIDIWILGCLIFELATNEPLFPMETFGLNREQIDDIHEKLLHHIDDDNYFTAYLSERLPSDFGNENTRQFFCRCYDDFLKNGRQLLTCSVMASFRRRSWWTSKFRRSEGYAFDRYYWDYRIYSACAANR